MIVSVYNIHRNPDVWDQPEEFLPERFPLDDAVPNEQNTNYRYTSCVPASQDTDRACHFNNARSSWSAGHRMVIVLTYNRMNEA